MKRLIILASMFTIVSVASAAAQDLYKNDPGYHINNYKHPNKAAHAAKKNTNTMNVSKNVAVNRNYKQVGNNRTEKALEIVRTEPKEVYLTRQNYKMPFSTIKKEEKQVAIKVDTTVDKENQID
ncbi:MAG: hypothetical protein U5N85_19500 [Arcicella sp.]|nr:hypothetical protein [Arcicella sp.]